MSWIYDWISTRLSIALKIEESLIDQPLLRQFVDDRCTETLFIIPTETGYTVTSIPPQRVGCIFYVSKIVKDIDDQDELLFGQLRTSHYQPSVCLAAYLCYTAGAFARLKPEVPYTHAYLIHLTQSSDASVKNTLRESPLSQIDSIDPSSYANLGLSSPGFLRQCNLRIQDWINDVSEKVDVFKKSVAEHDFNGINGAQAKLVQLREFQNHARSARFRSLLGFLYKVSSLPYGNADLGNGDRELLDLRMELTSALRRWRIAEMGLAEAVHESHEFLKYLDSFYRALSLLKTGTMAEALEHLSTLIESLSMSLKLSKKERSSQHLAPLASEIIKLCKGSLLPDSIRENPSYIQLTAFQNNLISAMNLLKAFEESANRIYSGAGAACEPMYEANLALFSRRIGKLMEIVSITSQMRLIRDSHLEGVHEILDRFDQVMTAFATKQRENFLEYTQNSFDRDFIDWNMQCQGIEAQLCRAIASRLNEFNGSVRESCQFLRRVDLILIRDRLRDELSFYREIVCNQFGDELLRVQEVYERTKASPPLTRDLPPAAGHILWSRSLLKHIEAPMAIGVGLEGVLRSVSGGRAIVKLYNRLARTLIEYETVWYQAWINSIQDSRSGLDSPIVAFVNSSWQVNLNPELRNLLREAKCIERLGLLVPDAGQFVLHQERRLKTSFMGIKQILNEYNRLGSLVPSIAASLLAPHLESIDLALRAGATPSLTWMSLSIPVFVESIRQKIRRFDDFLQAVRDCTLNRIETPIDSIPRVTDICTVTPGTAVNLLSFATAVERVTRECMSVVATRSEEIEAAVDDLISHITSFPINHSNQVPESELIKLKAHYQWSMYRMILARILEVLKNIRGIRQARSPLIAINLEFNGMKISTNPSFEDVQSCLSHLVLGVLQSTKLVSCWSIRGSAGDNLATVFDRLVQDKEILNSLLLTTGSISAIMKDCRGACHESNFDDIAWLWTKTFEGSQDFESDSTYIDSITKTLFSDARFGLCIVGPILINGAALRDSVSQLASRWRLSLCESVSQLAKNDLERAVRTISEFKSRLSPDVVCNDTESLSGLLAAVHEVRRFDTDRVDETIGTVSAMYSFLERLRVVPVLKDEQDALSQLKANWSSVMDLCRDREAQISANRVEFARCLSNSIDSFASDLAQVRHLYVERGPMSPGLTPREAVDRLRRFRDEFEMRNRRAELLRIGEHVLGWNNRKYAELDATRAELSNLGQLYDLYVTVLDDIEVWKTLSLGSDLDQIRNQLDAFGGQCKKLPKQLKGLAAYEELRNAIDEFSNFVPIITELSKKSIMRRHWDNLQTLTGFRGEDPVTIGSLLKAEIGKYRDDIMEMCDSADKEMVIENRLAEIETTWSLAVFDFGNWKSRDYACVLSGGRVSEIQERLEETFMALNTMNSMRHSIPFRDKLTYLLNSLSDTMEILEKWTKVQLQWASLESVFTSGDIARQMPIEAKKFQSIDKDWIRIMAAASDVRLVVQCCQSEMLRQLLPALSQGLEVCQKSLENYLESKRNIFPRFYFVSDQVLLKILSQGSDPENIQDDLEKVFDAVSRVVFDKNDKRKILRLKGIVGAGEEVIDLVNPVHATGNIEDWLSSLETEMQKAVRRECKQAALMGGSLMNGLSVKDFSNRFIAQVALLGIQLVWTSDVQEALKGDKTAMLNTGKKCQSILNELVSICLSDLGSRMNRTKFETLVTIHVHQRDLLVELFKKSKEHKLTDFDWSKQTRFYWKPESDNAIVSIADVDFTYSYEYLGVKERLVITPLTDRCYLTLSQALGICYGGAPVGPAGTGKTETVKDMARTLGLYCVVTNCSDQHRYKDMAKIFKGLCSSGIFGCFDEFNRIELEVLSVVAMQIEAITLAKKQHMKTFLFPGESVPIRLVPSLGYFITMNPGYAGRQELPENLKNLFRSVSMMVPDREIIMRVKLASVGFSQMDLLGKKFNILYQLCEQQLSKQRHYDFGLRNILSVLRTAGGVKRSEPPETDEELLFMRTVRDMNLSKLVSDDVPLFLALLRDLFPRVSDPPKKGYADIEAGIEKLIIERKLVSYIPWKLKAIQLYETSLVRHGLMLVGPTLTGKTEIINILTSCLTESANSPHRVVTLNPKAITDAQMYGVKDPLSDEWTPGVFSSIWQKYNNRSLKYTTWIVCDGPVDAIWIENLNSVLDDNKILTLANNDRIPMTDNCRILFEVENLNNASPATVSRAGIIYVSDSDLTWTCLVESWLKRFDENIQTSVKNLTDCFIPPLLEWTRDHSNCNRVFGVSDSVVVNNYLNLLSGLFTENNMSDRGIQRTIIYAIVWAMGGLLDAEDRPKFTAKMFDIAKLKAMEGLLPILDDSMAPTLFEFWPHTNSREREWSIWKAQSWAPSPAIKLSVSNLLIPTMDSVRSEYLMSVVSMGSKTRSRFNSTLLLGLSGTAKTSTTVMFLEKSATNTLWKRVNLSSATTPWRLQKTIEAEIERKTGKTFCPPSGKKLVMYIDDLSMPLVNQWGDQATLELVRQTIENNGFFFLDKEKRGDFKTIENVDFIGSMVNPGGGRNDIPNRLKSKFFSFSLVMPNLNVVDSIYGTILRTRFAELNNNALLDTVTTATIDVWEKVKKNLLPTPQRFHYVFNMRDLSRVFQGILDAPTDAFQSDVTLTMTSLWRHECMRVFTDKLARQIDKDSVVSIMNDVQSARFAQTTVNASWWADFQRDCPIDDNGEELSPPKIYEPVMDLNSVRNKAYEYLRKFNQQFPSMTMNLVLFDESLFHLMRIVRIVQQKRGSAILVGVGGSGKQSLARLASFICNQRHFRIAVTKSYNENAFFDDLRTLYIECAQKNNTVTFVLTDADIKFEEMLEHMNSIMATGEIAGLFQKDEREAMCADVRDAYRRETGAISDDSITFNKLQQFLTDRFRDNLHVVFCFSPVNAKFSTRAQKFPAIFANANINWFLPWPQSALISVGSGLLADKNIDIETEARTSLYEWLSRAYDSVNEVCSLYYNVMRRRIYVTPKSYLSLIQTFANLYAEKFGEVNAMEKAVNVGLTKLDEAAADVERLKINLIEEERDLKISEIETNSLLARVRSESVKAEAKAVEVGGERDACLTKKAEIEKEQAEAERDLQAALPFLREAENAVKSITAKDVTELKTLKQPSDIIRLVFDGLLILQQKRVCEVRSEKKNVNKQAFDFIHDSYDEISKSLLTDIRFLPDLFEFSDKQKDNINNETCELLEPYLSLPTFTPAIAKNASGAAEGLCKWVGAMVSYHRASLIVKPKMDYLRIQESKLAAAMSNLKEAESELEAANKALADLNNSFNEAKERKVSLEASAHATKTKMDQAEKLITGLAGEKIRWSEDSKTFANRRRQLIGDVGLAAAFMSFCGAFNTEFREKLLREHFIPGLQKLNIPFTESFDFVKFVGDPATIGEWVLEGLPSDDLSIQNAILVTKGNRCPLMIDPQGQALRWIKSREAKRIAGRTHQCVTTLGNPRLKDQIEYTTGEGLCLLIENVENDVDPIIDPLLDKAIVKKGRNWVITVSDQEMDFNPAFSLYLTSRLPNPHFSPELFARCSVIDFTVTQRGLEQQLLGRVLAAEQKELEESLGALMEDVTRNTKSLQLLDRQLLQRLSDSSGNLLDDTELIQVLAITKQTAREVEVKLKHAEEKRIEINQKREQYRPVATRGSVMYFCMTDMTQVVHPVSFQPVGWMYNCSLMQFLEQFDLSISRSEKSQQTIKRVDKIVDLLTYQVYRYMNRGLFERDKTLFKLLLALRAQTVTKQLTLDDIALFLRAGTSLDAKSEKPNPFLKWMPEKIWLNVIQLTRHSRPLLPGLIDLIAKNEQGWRRWFDHNEPESVPIPDIEETLSRDKAMGAFIRCLLVRCLREDRTTIAASDYVSKQLDGRFTKPVTDSIESVYADSSSRKPILYLLSAGSDPSWAIDELAKKQKRLQADKISMGEGQEVIAYEKIRSAFLTGSWVVLQNCHLGLGFMEQLEDILTKTSDIDPEFRLWITCEVNNKFPIGLLQISIKVTMEPPTGLRAGLARTFSTTVSQDLIERIDHEKWRKLVFVQAFIHSIVQERRKFGPIGWCVPYEFNNSDLEASLLFIEKHLAATVAVGQPVSWSTIQYMVASVQYGGRITDNVDAELFDTYAAKWLCEDVFKSGFVFGQKAYSMPEGIDINNYREFIDSLPSVDSPLIFGLHPNADLSYRQLEASLLLAAIQDTQPKTGDTSSGVSITRDEVVRQKAVDIVAKLPKDYIEAEVRSLIAKLKGPPGSSDKGFQAPLNIFLFQEIQRIQRVIAIVRSSLSNLINAIDGNVVMTPELMENLNMIFEAKIPRTWTHDASGAEISWLVPNLGAWFTGLVDRVQQLSNWLEHGRLKAYWLTGFLNPQGFLTAMRQEVTRQHKKDQWSLDDVITHTTVLNVDVDKVKEAPDEGQYIFGLFLEGAKWNRHEGKLEESDPKKLSSQLPVIHVTAVTLKDKKTKSTDHGPYGPFDCPVYKYPKRTDKYMVMRLNLKTDVHPSHWRMRGVGALCSIE